MAHSSTGQSGFGQATFSFQAAKYAVENACVYALLNDLSLTDGERSA
ncbi:MAG: hypothetical protein ACFBZ9_05305 [Sphingomonadales bacterium]